MRHRCWLSRNGVLALAQGLVSQAKSASTVRCPIRSSRFHTGYTRCPRCVRRSLCRLSGLKICCGTAHSCSALAASSDVAVGVSHVQSARLVMASDQSFRLHTYAFHRIPTDPSGCPSCSDRIRPRGEWDGVSGRAWRVAWCVRCCARRLATDATRQRPRRKAHARLVC